MSDEQKKSRKAEIAKWTAFLVVGMAIGFFVMDFIGFFDSIFTFK